MKIFHQKSIYCPVCTQTSELHLLVSEVFGVYYPARRERDQYVSQWQWREPGYEDINPYHYALISCPICHYTDFIENFATHPKDLSSRQTQYIRNNLLALPPHEKSHIKQIGAILHNTLTTRNNETATLSYLLALSFQNLLVCAEQISESPNLLARLNLRLSWLFRETANRPEDIEPDKQITSEYKIEYYVYEMIQHIHDFNILSRKIEEQCDNDYGDEHLKPILNILSKNADNIEKKTEALLKVLQEQKARYEHGTRQLLEKSYALWPWLPKTEQQAAERAIYYFEQVCATDNSLSNKAAWQIMELMAYLYDRFDEVEKRNRCLSELLTSCHKQRALIMHKLKGDLSIAQRDNMETHLNKLNAYIQEITFQYKYEYNEQSAI